MTTTIQIVPASYTDASDLAHLVLLCNANDLLFSLIAPLSKNTTPEQKAEHLRWRTERIRTMMQRAGTHWFKAIDASTNQTIGFAGVVDPQAEQSTWSSGAMSETVDAERFAEFGRLTLEKKGEVMGERVDFWHISSMVVHPEYQGRGIGSRLLSKICVLADKTGQDVYLEATPAGTKLYLNAGFQPVGDISFLDGEYVIICMLKKAGLTT